VLGLGEHVGGQPFGVCRSVGQDGDFTRARDHVDADLSDQQALGRGHEDVARSGDDVDLGDSLRAVGQGRNGPGGTAHKDVRKPQDGGGGQDVGVQGSVLARRADHADGPHSCDLGRDGVHEQAGYERRLPALPAGHVQPGAVHGQHELAKRGAGGRGGDPGILLLAQVKIADVGGGLADDVRVGGGIRARAWAMSASGTRKAPAVMSGQSKRRVYSATASSPRVRTWARMSATKGSTLPSPASRRDSQDSMPGQSAGEAYSRSLKGMNALAWYFKYGEGWIKSWIPVFPGMTEGWAGSCHSREGGNPCIHSPWESLCQQIFYAPNPRKVNSFIRRESQQPLFISSEIRDKKRAGVLRLRPLQASGVKTRIRTCTESRRWRSRKRRLQLSSWSGAQ
jgi:hypothetical protein